MNLQQAFIALQRSLEQAFLVQEKQQILPEGLKQQVFAELQHVEQCLAAEPNADFCMRVKMNINNIRSSIFHEPPSAKIIHATETGV